MIYLDHEIYNSYSVYYTSSLCYDFSIQPVILRCEPPWDFTTTGRSHLLQQQRSFRLVSGFAAKVFDFSVIMVPQIIKPQAILFRIHNRAQFGL